MILSAIIFMLFLFYFSNGWLVSAPGGDVEGIQCDFGNASSILLFRMEKIINSPRKHTSGTENPLCDIISRHNDDSCMFSIYYGIQWDYYHGI